MHLSSPSELITVSDAAELSGLSRQQLRRLWKRGVLSPPVGSSADGRRKLLVREEVEALVLECDNHLYTVTLDEFARRLGLSPQTIRSRYKSDGCLVGGRLHFRDDFVVSTLAKEWVGPPDEFTVSASQAAKQIGCHANTLSRHLKGKGLRRGRVIYYRQDDVDAAEWKIRRNQLVDEDYVRRLLGASHPIQVYYLAANPRCEPRLFDRLAQWQKGVSPMPSPQKIKPNGQWLWRYGYIEEWTFMFRVYAEKLLQPDSLKLYRELGDVNITEQGPIIPKGYDERAHKYVLGYYSEYRRWRKNGKKNLPSNSSDQVSRYLRRKHLRQALG